MHTFNHAKVFLQNAADDFPVLLFISVMWGLLNAEREYLLEVVHFLAANIPKVSSCVFWYSPPTLIGVVNGFWLSKPSLNRASFLP